MEPIAIRLEAIAIRLEAITIRLEAIAIRHNDKNNVIIYITLKYMPFQIVGRF